MPSAGSSAGMPTSQGASGFPPHGLSLQQGCQTSCKVAGFKELAPQISKTKAADLLRPSLESFSVIVPPPLIAQNRASPD